MTTQFYDGIYVHNKNTCDTALGIAIKTCIDIDNRDRIKLWKEIK